MLSAITAITDSGDRAFMEHIYRQHHKRMKYIAYSYIHDPAAAEDVTHDAFIALIGKVDLLRALPESKRARYIMVTAQNTALKEIRRRGTREERLQYGLEGLEGRLLGGAPDPLEMLMEQESLEAIHAMLQKLSDADRLILYYRCELGYNNLEIAEAMGISSAASRQRYSRAHKRALGLREEVMQHD